MFISLISKLVWKSKWKVGYFFAVNLDFKQYFSASVSNPVFCLHNNPCAALAMVKPAAKAQKKKTPSTWSTHCTMSCTNVLAPPSLLDKGVPALTHSCPCTTPCLNMVCSFLILWQRVSSRVANSSCNTMLSAPSFQGPQHHQNQPTIWCQNFICFCTSLTMHSIKAHGPHGRTSGSRLPRWF